MKTSLVAVMLMAAALAGTASADPSNRNAITLAISCPDRTFTGVTIEHNSAVVFQIEGEQGVAITQQISFVDPESGETVVVRTNPGVGHELVSCTYHYPGFEPLVTGLFQLPGA